MKIVIAGASGFVGRALVPELRAANHEVFRLVRRAVAAPDEITWTPEKTEIDVRGLEGADAIINLAGENLSAGRWTEARREQILRSRVEATRTLVLALDGLKTRPTVFINASAVGFYGSRDNETLTESSPIGTGFLPEVCLAWESHAEGAARKGLRTVLMRFGLMLAREGGALAKMLPAFRAGLGGPLGDGTQWMSWIERSDAVAAIRHVLANDACRGPVNFAAPNPVVNREFAAALGRALGRPAVLAAPAFALRLAFGQMADEALLASTRAVPRRLVETGFRFRYPVIDQALQAALR